MQEQTNQLLLWNEQEDAPVPQVQLSKEISEYKERLRLLNDLKSHKGYQLLIQALKDESQACLVSMDKSDNPTSFTKYAANYYSLTMACGYVDNEILRLRAFLNSIA